MGRGKKCDVRYAAGREMWEGAGTRPVGSGLVGVRVESGLRSMPIALFNKEQISVMI